MCYTLFIPGDDLMDLSKIRSDDVMPWVSFCKTSLKVSLYLSEPNINFCIKFSIKNHHGQYKIKPVELSLLYDVGHTCGEASDSLRNNLGLWVLAGHSN